MLNKVDRRLWVATREEFAGEGAYKKIDVSYNGIPATVIVFRFKDVFLAYYNQCVHMPRELDCQQNTIFDETGRYLRCSMHGIVYDLVTGESISTMCNGEKLTSVRIQEDTEGIWIKDKRVKPLARSTRNRLS